MVKRTKEPPELIGGVSDAEARDRVAALRCIDRLHRDSKLGDREWQRIRNIIAPGIGDGQPAAEKLRALNLKRQSEGQQR